MKVNGALWKEFYNDEDYWQGRYHDDTVIMFDGIEQDEYDSPSDDAVVEIKLGYVHLENATRMDRSLQLSTFFSRWKKYRHTEVLVVTVNKDYSKSVMADIKQLEGVLEVR